MIRDERGVTLTELLLAIAIMALITGTLGTAIYQILDITSRGSNELVVQHDLRNAAVWLNRDVLSASKATVTQEGDDYKMVLEVPHLKTSPAVTTTISHITYTYSEDTGDLTRESDFDGSSHTIARHIVSNPFPPLDTTIEAPDVVAITLGSLEGKVPGSGTFALKMRAGGYIRVEGLCQIVAADDLDIALSTHPPEPMAVQWDITNNGSDEASIEQILITWLITDTALTEIWWDDGTNPIFAESRPPPTATIIKPRWGSGDRTIAGGQKTLEFWFEVDAVDDEDLYSIEITFDNGCIISFP